MFSSSALYLACFIALALNPSAVYSLPIPPRASTTVLPVRFSEFNPQRPFSRPAPPTKLRFAPDEQQQDTPSAPSAFAAVASPSSLSDPTTIDTIFADSLQAGGVEASLAAVLAARQMQRVDGLRRDALAPRLVPGVKKVVKRDWVQPGRPTAVAVSTSTTSSSSSFTTPAASSTSPFALSPSSTEPATPSSVVWTISEPAEEEATTIPTPSSTSTSSTAPGKLVWYLAPEPTQRFLLPKASFGSLSDSA